MNKRFHVLVIGAGPAGIAAAVRAAESGQRVGLLDDNPAAGGQIWRKGANLPKTARKWLARLNAVPVERLHGWHVFGSPASGVLFAERTGLASPASEEADFAELSYDKLILATGARERFLPFPGWTLPNVMGAGGLDAMARGGLPISGKRVVVAGTGPLLLAVAAHLAHRGAQILAICEQAPLSRLRPFAMRLLAQPGKVVQGISLRFATRGAHFYTSCWPVAASGEGKLESVTLQRGGRQWELACDYLACGYHLVPNLELPRLLGCGVHDGFVKTDKWQRTSIPGIFCAGEPTGIGGVELAILEGQIAGLAAIGRVEKADHLIQERTQGQRFVRALREAFELDPHLRALPSGETLVCRCEDVPFGVLRGYASARDAKLHTRCGMGACQGRICGAATEFVFGWSTDSVRPPILPASLSTLAATGSLAASLASNTTKTMNQN
ncbi:MAG: FAD/NAD(P)-binding oxidoreductase [Acidobacteriaceae bacterium]